MAARYTLVQTKADLLVWSSALVYAIGAQSASTTSHETLKLSEFHKASFELRLGFAFLLRGAIP